MLVLAILVILASILILSLAWNTSEDPLRHFTLKTSEKRHLVDTCPEAHPSINARYTRRKFTLSSSANDCSPLYFSGSPGYFFEIGPKSGDYYLQGYCSSPENFFVARFGTRYYKTKWAKTGGNETFRLFVDNQEGEVYRLTNKEDRYLL